jgi:hypothetical protein
MHGGLLARVRNPAPELPVPIGVPVSRGDIAAQAQSLAAAEALFGRAGGARRIVASLARLLGDSEAAELALKKALVCTLEERMRWFALRDDPPDRYGFDPVRRDPGSHALDSAAGGPRPPVSARIVFAVHVLVRALDLIARACAPLFGPGLAAPPRHAAFAFLANIRDNSIPIFAAAAQRRLGADVWLVADRAALLAERTDNDLPRLAADRTPVLRDQWLREAVWPALRLAGGTLRAALANLRDPASLQLAADALRYGRDALAQRRLLGALRPAVVFDVEEHSARHIVRAAELRRAGCRLARWPQSQLDEPGASLAYIGYDAFLASGPYIARAYGATWRRDCRMIAVGAMRNDRAFARDDLVAPVVKDAIVAARAHGQRVLAFFGISPGAVNHDRLLRMTEAVVAAVRDRPDWIVVVKPKGAEDGAMLRSMLPSHPRIVLAPYVQQGLDPCPAGWLIAQMDLAAAVGSVQIESLVRGKPAIGFRTIFHDTAMTRALVKAGLLHADFADFAAALGRAMDDPAGLDVPYGWFRDNLDPFGDANAFDRIFDALAPGAPLVRPEAA